MSGYYNIIGPNLYDLVVSLYATLTTQLESLQCIITLISGIKVNDSREIFC